MYLVDICIYYHFKKDKRTEADRSICFNLIFLGCFCFILCRFQASKPMWKLYLVWAILSSVTLLYIISKRCNVMSTIKTHKMAPVGSVSSGFACFCRCDWTRPSIDEKASQFSLFIFFPPFYSHYQCEIYKEPHSALSVDIDRIKNWTYFAFLCVSLIQLILGRVTHGCQMLLSPLCMLALLVYQP